MSAGQRRQAVRHLQQTFGVSQRRACRVLGGAPLPLEGAILVAGIYLILPLFFIFGGLAMMLDSPRCAKVVLWLAAAPLLILVPMVGCYEPAIGELDQAAQTGGWMSIWLYGFMTLGSLVLLRVTRIPNVGGPAAQASAG